MRQRHQSYFYHSKKERNALIILLLCCLVFAAIPKLYYLFEKKPAFAQLEFPEITEWIKIPAEKKYTGGSASFIKEKTSGRAAERFVFDPNTASENDWQRLGLAEKQIAIIKNYLSKGGQFREPADIGKIWGMPPLLVNELKPYIKIKKNFFEGSKFSNDKKWEQKQVHIVNINTADSLEFLSLPGIGPKLSSRIIRFREKLGGFLSVNQVAETFGLADSVFQKIKPQLKCINGQVKKININTATLDELRQHPYIRYQLAKLILAYREQHGNFNNMASLRSIMLITDSLYERINPYITVY